MRRESNGMRKPVWLMGGVLISLGCFFLWGVAAMNYGSSAAIGTYHFERDGETSTLVLNPDHTFRQARWLGSHEQHSQGTWRRVGEGGISFSKDFLVVSGDEPEPDGTTFSDMHKALGLFTSLRLRQYHVLWYGKTSSDNSLAGTYTGDEPGVTATLVLNADHSFSQTIAHGLNANHATGTWSQDSDGKIRYSDAFLKTSGEPLGPNESASSIDPKGSNLQVEISMSEHVIEPVFKKR
jgi:hypothetical protein